MPITSKRIPTDKDLIDTLGSKIGVTPVTEAYTLLETDAGHVVNVTAGSGVNVTIPADTFVVGQMVDVLQGGAGAATVVAGSGVTLRVDATNTAVTNGQWSKATVTCIADNEFVINGELVPAV